MLIGNLGRIRFRESVAAGVLVAAFAATGWAIETPNLMSTDPFRLNVDPSGKAQVLTIRGTGFEDQGHPDRDMYMHWQVRRTDGAWEPCMGWASSPAALCRSTGWTGGSEVIKVGGKYVAKEGFLEFRAFHGLADVRSMNPDDPPAGQHTGWSNVIRVPVVAPKSPPSIVSLSKKEFPTNGTPADYRFVIDAVGLDGGNPVVVFRGDVVVWPERIDAGHLIQVTVPDVYRRKTSGELPLSVRTDRGGESALVYIRFVEPPKRTNLPVMPSLPARPAPQRLKP